MINLNLLIEQAGEMTPFRPSVVRLAQLLSGQDCALSDVMDLIAYDGVLTMKLLRAANCVANAGLAPVVTPQEAVTRLGTNLVLNLAVAAGVRPHMQRGIASYGYDEGGLWRHSVAAAVVAQIVPGFCTIEMPAEAFTVALLHDIGKVVMGRFLSPAALHYISSYKAGGHVDQMEAEAQILGVHHGELGGLIAQNWQLSHRVVQGITHHHDPSEGRDVVCDLAFVSNEAAKRIQASVGNEPATLSIPDDVAARLGTTTDLLDRVCPLAASRFLQVSECYNAV